MEETGEGDIAANVKVNKTRQSETGPSRESGNVETNTAASIRFRTKDQSVVVIHQDSPLLQKSELLRDMMSDLEGGLTETIDVQFSAEAIRYRTRSLAGPRHVLLLIRDSMTSQSPGGCITRPCWNGRYYLLQGGGRKPVGWVRRDHL